MSGAPESDDLTPLIRALDGAGSQQLSVVDDSKIISDIEADLLALAAHKRLRREEREAEVASTLRMLVWRIGTVGIGALVLLLIVFVVIAMFAAIHALIFGH